MYQNYLNNDIPSRYNCLLAVDAVVSTAAVPLYVDRWKIDAVVAGTQKAIGAPPGLALTTYSPLAKYVIIDHYSNAAVGG